MFEIVLQAYREKIYSIKLKDVKNILKANKCLLRLLLLYVLAVGIFWYCWWKTRSRWLFLLLFIFIFGWVTMVNRITRFSYTDRYKRKKETISDLAKILQELDLYREQKIELILNECAIWLNRGDKFTNITKPVVKYITIVCVPIIMFFIGLAVDQTENMDVNIIGTYMACAITVLIIAGVFLGQAASIIKQIINREYDAAQSLQLLLTDLKMYRFWK